MNKCLVFDGIPMINRGGSIMMFRKFSIVLRAAALLAVAAVSFTSGVLAQASYIPSTMQPPAVPREFRAAWIATVGNIDWPSAPGLPVAQQKQEMLALLDRAVQLKLNAVILQVRPACDAIYPSKIEPWSYYLTGQMGKAPEPYYDPLEFAITEAHKRGLELHAWFNPYRAELLAHKYAVSKNHISKTHPSMALKYGSYLWLDPGLKEVQDYSLRVVMDVVKRYDVDGVHFDDYFYPYREKDAKGNELPFPDYASWRRYHDKGTLSRDDWRRENVNQFIQHVYDSIKATKPWVKFGISPFGIWQPGYPQQVKGFNSYEVLYCDSRKWLANGWLDYCAPQLYWSIDSKDQSFPVLLKWWLENNPKHRNVWPGLDDQRVGGKWQPEEILNQIKLTRELSGATPGEIHWSFKALNGQRTPLGSEMASKFYGEPALVPPSPWLEQRAPAKPPLVVEKNGKIKWTSSPMMQAMSLWVLQTKDGNGWHTRILPGHAIEESLPGSPDVIALTAIDKCNVASEPAVLQKSATATAEK